MSISTECLCGQHGCQRTHLVCISDTPVALKKKCQSLTFWEQEQVEYQHTTNVTISARTEILRILTLSLLNMEQQEATVNHCREIHWKQQLNSTGEVGRDGFLALCIIILIFGSSVFSNNTYYLIIKKNIQKFIAFHNYSNRSKWINKVQSVTTK